MIEEKLTLAHHKTEMVLISNRKAVQLGSVGACIINSTREVRQLGVMINDPLSFDNYIDHACGRAVKVISALFRIMTNNWAASSSKKRLLAGPVWVTALQTTRNTPNYLVRGSLRAGTIPINLLFECYRGRGTRGVRKQARADTLRKCNFRDKAVNGRWTHRLSPYLSVWMN
ncbi:uncharacterized protein LOC131687173 [Topomyia yanbarensis]|uniref:uncharacterized protein LOC131687173 n=1 Tax=Topomyia yanbarensis TaxID=2498891 RepID=UPI00273B66D2|nr:uncharacterized protein LOC131687173 [Topomyia yanbarensis]